MSVYLLDYTKPLSGGARYNGNIARKDVETTFLSIGAKFLDWKPLCTFNIRKLNGFMWQIGYACALWKNRNIFVSQDEAYIQYPYWGFGIKYIVKALKRRGVRVTFLVHDLEVLRFYNVPQIEIDKQVRLLNSADCVLVHTTQMRDRLQQCGVTTTMKPILLFDYYAKDPYRDIEEQKADKNTIAFAGCLDKSTNFLKKLDASDIPSDYIYNFYGVKPKTEFLNKQISYQGKFSPEHTGGVHAGWGLVWDGNDIDSCTGSLGEYLKMIAPHKLSLYIASGIPVIVWSQSAHAQFVKDQNIGIVVDSINDVYGIIHNISDENYLQKILNTRKIGDELRRGGYLKRVVSDSYNE